MNCFWILFYFMLLLSIFKIDGTSNKLKSCDTTKHTKILGSCCNVPRNDQYSRACRQSLLSKTDRIVNNTEARNLRQDKVALHACMAECVFKKNGFLYSNGTVNLSVMQRSLEQRYKKDAALAKLVTKSLISCADYAMTRTKQFEWLHAKDNCDYYPATLLACIMEQVYQNCPASLWKNTEDCAAMKKFLIACDDVKKNRK